MLPTFEMNNLNLGYNFQTRRGRGFTLHICIPCDKIFHMVLVYDFVTLTLILTCYSKTLTLAATINVFSYGCHPASVVVIWQLLLRGQYILKY